ncbi:amidase [Roseateles sp. DAIF2]|uniref:amidase n=1 Tax=Roseateles sp. DAIF2 TaxID=2714952 RepID=UPI0018A28AF9|nr:amidase [Roseateles sp. DAIF2]QPF74897.1 amidase [Roseateles sp. DAIF2]
MPHDLSSALDGLRNGRLQAAELLQRSLDAARGEACRHAFVRLFPAPAVAEPNTPLGGLAISIKDLFDVASQPTTAASRSLADAAPAAADSPAVARLRGAGAALIGHTNLSEFAFSGLGLNPHHGTPLNPATRAIDGLARIPGGSTSGGAVSVAAGAAWAALGSDTGGSIRIPAALCGLVGFKNTARLTPAEGGIPLATSLDTTCAITRSVRDAVLLHEILAARRVALQARPWSARRLGVPRAMLEGLDSQVARDFERALARLSAAGARIETIDPEPLRDFGALQLQGGLAAAESWAWHRLRLAARESDYDPRVALRIKRGAALSAADYIDLLQARRAWIARMEAALQGFDALLSPTVPRVAPELAPLLADDEHFFTTNLLMLRNTSVVNLLDGCAISLPCHAPGELPTGLMLWAPAMHDDALLSLALQAEAALANGEA